MKFSLEMLGARLPDLLAAARRETVPLGPMRCACGPIQGARAPAHDDSAWNTLHVGDRWGGSGLTCWLRVPLCVPRAWAEHRVAAHVVLGDFADNAGPEALAYLDGVPVQGIDLYHADLVLDDRVKDGQEHLLALEAHSSSQHGPQTLRALELVRFDADAEALYHDMRVLYGALLTMPAESLERARLLRALENAYHTLDLRRPWSDGYLHSARAAREVLRRDVHGRAAAEGGPRIVAVGHAHIDLAWLWPVAQTRRKAARTFSTVLRLMEQYPAYHFVASQPALYKMLMDDEPALYARVKERIAEGRWEPTGATWVEMDCNVSGGEALVRQFLHGKQFFRRELGVDPRALWLPDVFGYSAALPQVMKGCGVDYFMTTKISWNEYNRLPYDTFRWRGIDGTEVLTHMVTAPLNPDEESATMQPYYTYNAKLTPYDVSGTWSAYRQKDINDELLYLFGHGDGGGGPTAEMLETAARLTALPGFPAVEQSSAEAYFRRLDERVWPDPDLPLWAGELYLEYHRGTYTSQAWIKRANRKAELLFREAELWLAAATPLLDALDVATCRQELRAGWETILFNQFHDILPGSSIAQVYVDAGADFHAVFARGEAIRAQALDALAASVGPSGAATPGTSGAATSGPSLLLFNPAPFARDEPVELRLPPGAAVPLPADDGGQPLPVQELQRDEEGLRVLVGCGSCSAAGGLPPLGYCVIGPAAPGAAVVTGDGGLRIEREVLENRFFRLQLDERAHIVSLYDKRAAREVIAPGEGANRLIAFEDRPLKFDAWDINIYYNDKPYPLDDVASWRIVERGPLRGGVEIERRYGESVITQRILLYADLPRIDFPTRIDWRERQTLLKVAFPVTINSPHATFDIQWGNVARPTHWNTSWDWARFETCAHKWIDLSEGDYGVSLLNDCKYGHDVKGHTMRLTLLKSAISPDPDADQGVHEFCYALLPHQGDWRTGETVRHAYLFNMPATARLLSVQGDSSSSGALPAAMSLISTDRPGLVVETVKPAEDGDGIIVRVYEAHNTRGPATLTFAGEIASAEQTNMLEEPLGPAEYAGRELRFDARPYGIATFRVRLSASDSPE